MVHLEAEEEAVAEAEVTGEAEVGVRDDGTLGPSRSR